MALADRLEALRTADINKDLGRGIMLLTELTAFLRNHDDRSARVEVSSTMRKQGIVRELLVNRALIKIFGSKPAH